VIISSIFTSMRYDFYTNVTTLLSGVCRHNSVCLSVCLSSVTFVHPTQPVEIFANVFTPFVDQPSFEHHTKFYEDRPKEIRPTGVKRNRGSQI